MTPIPPITICHRNKYGMELFTATCDSREALRSWILSIAYELEAGDTIYTEDASELR